MVTNIQPSSDPRSTAIAVAWAVADRTMITAGATNSEQEAKKRAALVGELARSILDAIHQAGGAHADGH